MPRDESTPLQRQSIERISMRQLQHDLRTRKVLLADLPDSLELPLKHAAAALQISESRFRGYAENEMFPPEFSIGPLKRDRRWTAGYLKRRKRQQFFFDEDE